MVFSLSYIFIVAGQAFGGMMTVIGFGGLIAASFHRALGTPLPLPTIHSAFERRVYVYVGLAGFVVWSGSMLCSFLVTP